MRGHYGENMQERTEAVNAAMADIRQIEAHHGVTRAGVELIRDRLVALSAQRELFPPDDFAAPGPDDDRKSILYRLAQDDDDRFALYAQTSRGSVSTPVHNHTTWAVVVGHRGQELNRFFERDEESGVRQTHEHMVEAGTGVAMLPEDLHSIHIEGPSLNFHCYGLALERLEAREYYHESSGSWKIFAATSEIREARSTVPTC